MKKQLLFCLSFLAILLGTSAQERLIGANAYGIDPLSKGVVFTMNTDGSNYSPKHDFIQSWGIGVDVVDGQDGFLYGIAAGNGASASSVAFKMRYDGTQYKTLHVFVNSTEGYQPRYRPALHPNGYIYGVCELGGTSNNGTVWKLKRDGTDFSVMKHFSQSVDGVNGAYGSVSVGFDGKLYGLAAGGSNGNGAIFKMNAIGSPAFSYLSFASATTGKDPRATLYQASDGKFYGVCFSGGANGLGTIFRLAPGTGSTVGTLTNAWSFTTANGANPQTTLTEGGNGYLYGGCSTGGANNKGIIFQFDKASSTLTDKIDLDATTGGSPGRQLYFSSDDNIFGFTTTGGTSGAGTFFTVNGSGPVVLKDGFGGGTNVNSFTYDPVSRMIYGVAANGGLRSAGLSFKIKTDGTGFQLCHQFLYHWMGSALTGKLAYIQQANALFNRVYGICYTEGLYERGSLYTLFPDIANSFRVVKQFTVANGLNPSAVIAATDQKLYGTFKDQGTDGSTSYSGSVFSINPAINDTFTFVKGFTASTTGLLQPIGDLLEASNGFLYGTALTGGTSNLGGVFKVKKDGTGYQTIRQFATADGSGPVGGLVQDAATGLIYGVTQAGGSTGGGTMFTINPSAGDNFQVIYQVPASTYFNGGLLIINDSIYGTSSGGGTSSVGTMYKMKKDGSAAHTVLKNFNNTDGGGPHGYLSKSTDGFIYGACGYGAVNSGGSIYKIYPDGTNFTVIKTFAGPEGQLPRPVTLGACNTAPYPNAGNITFGRIATNAITISGWTAPASNVNGYVIKINTNSTFTNMVNGANPTASTVYAGGEQVIYNGSSINPITVTNLQPGTVYHFKVFAFGGCTGRNYANDEQTGTFVAQGTTPTGVVGNTNLMAVLDGVDDYINVGDVNTIEGQSAISFGGWVKPMSFPTVDGQVMSIVSKGDESTGAGTMLSIRIYKSDGLVKLDATLGINNTQQVLTVNFDNAQLALNQWTHLFVTWQSGDRMRFYINGRGAGTTSTNITGLTNNVTAPLRFGYASTGYPNAQKFYGNLEEWQFYNFILSDCEIWRRKHIILTGAEPGLKLYYQFNEAGSTAFNDFVGSTTGTKLNGATAAISDLSAGTGGSACLEIGSPEYTYEFNATDLSNRLQLRFPGRGPNGFLNGSYLEAVPVGGNPNPGSNMLPGYWIIDNYGENTNDLQTNITFRLPDGILTDADMSHYTLYKRPSNGGGPWTAFPVNGVSLDAGNNSINISNIPSFSQLVITSTISALPLQLLSFDGSLINGDGSLKWETSNEVNVDHFELERKLPGESSFSKATSLLAKNAISNSYSFIDKKLPIGTTWYRLKMVDKDGKTTYSQIITIANKSSMIAVFPNPAKDFIHVVGAATKSIASLLSVDGRIIQGNINLVQNQNTINIQQLVPGIYILKIETANGAEMHRFVKQ